MVGVQKRVYVGNLLQNGDSCLAELRLRFTKFGQCLSDEFERYDTFAYINMEFDDESQFQRLKNSFNNVKFKGNELRVNQAKPSWRVAWQQKHEEDQKESHRLEEETKKRNWEFYKKIENINMSWDERRSVIPGRIRKHPRSKAQLRNVTFRVDVGGSLKVYKCYKTKLWGYERNKDAKDLAYKFVNNKWRDGHDHIVDRLDYSRSKKSIRSMIEQRPSSGSVDVAEDIEVEEEQEEKEKVSNVLASVLENFEFDKPLQLSDDEDFTIHSTEKLKHQHLANEDAKEKDLNDVSALPSENPQNSSSHEEKQDEEMDGDDDEEFIPTFTTQSGSHVTETKNENISNTETLRSLFNPDLEAPSSFKLIAESDEDIDHQNDMEVEEVTATPQEVMHTEQPSHKKEEQFLFFPHFDSPFLVGQTKLSKLKNKDIGETLNNWDETFWENRGNWTKEMKRRQRDALRLLNKKRARKNGGILL